MAFDFTSALTAMRRTVHTTFGVYVEYQHPQQVGTVTVGARWHNRVLLQGDLVDTGYADTIEGINQLVFNREELIEKGIELKRGGRIVFPAKWNNAILNLEALEPDNGPINVVWKVSKS